MKLTLQQFLLAQAPTQVEPVARDLHAIRRSRDLFAEALEAMRPLERDYESMIIEPNPDEPPPTGEQEEATREAREHLRVLREGNWSLGFRDARLAEFAGGPGMNHLLHWIRLCNDILGHEAKMRAIAWPAEHRYIGRPGAARLNGRQLRRGDVVRLSREQSESWSDRFALLDAEEQEAVTS